MKQGLTLTEATEIVETAAALTNTGRFDVMLAMSYIREQVKYPAMLYSLRI